MFARRGRAEGCDSTGLEQREMPEPTVRSVVAAVEGRTDFGARVGAEALRLGAPLAEGPSVPGDGAQWPWDLAEGHFHGAAQVLDIWRGAEKLAKAGRAAMGAGEEFAAWLEEAKGKLVADGYLPENLATAAVKKEWFDVGYRLLEMPVDVDAEWHRVWQQFKAGA